MAVPRYTEATRYIHTAVASVPGPQAASSPQPFGGLKPADTRIWLLAPVTGRWACQEMRPVGRTADRSGHALPLYTLPLLALYGTAVASPERDCALNILAFEFGAARVANTPAL